MSSSKFRHDSEKRNYKVRTFLRRCLTFGLVLLILLLSFSTLVAFFLLSQYEVRQSIQVTSMMNLTLRSKTLATIKTNEIEDIGTDLSTSARILSDLISYPEDFAQEDFIAAYADYLREGPAIAKCKTQGCEVPDGKRVYDIDYQGNIK